MSVLAAAFNWKGFTHALDHGHDSLLYVKLANSIVHKEWLGKYDHLTLIRQPIYSIFLALNSISGFRLHIFQYILSIAGTFMLCLALWNFRIKIPVILILFVIIIMHPMIILVTYFTITESLYLPLTIFLLAGAAGIYALHRCTLLKLLPWTFIFSFSFALLWHTRTESIWLLPGFTWLIISLFLLNKKRLTDYIPRLILIILLPACLTVSLGYFISSLNFKYYGVKVTHELDEHNFSRAFKQLVRVAPEHHKPYIPVPRKAMEKAFTVSPAFAELEDYMSRQFDGQGWSQAGFQWMGIDDELVNGWFMWAVRDGAHSLGKHSSAPEASSYYGRIAQEISKACAEGEITCTGNPTGNMLAPPITSRDILRIIPSFLKISWMTITFGEFSNGGPAFDPESNASENISQVFAPITHDQVAESPLFDTLFRPLHYNIYKFIHFICFAFMGIVLLQMAINKNFFSTNLPRFCFSLFCLIMILSRMGIITYLDAFSFHAQIRYLFPVYPFLLTFIFTFPWSKFQGRDTDSDQNA